MTATLKAVVQSGRIVTDELLDIPDGSEVDVTVTPVEIDIHGDSPESIAAWIALANSMEAPVLSDREWEELQRQRRLDREFELQNAEKRFAKLQATMP